MIIIVYFFCNIINVFGFVPTIFVKDKSQNLIPYQKGYIDIAVGSTIYLHCLAEKPIKWSYPVVDEMSGENRLRTKDENVCALNNRDISNCSSILELNSVKVENTGEYRCITQHHFQTSESLYIFVNDLKNIFIRFDKLEDIFIAAVQGQPLTIPCKTSFSFANVSLWTTDPNPKRIDLIHKMDYSPINGFYSPYALFGFLDKLQCHASVSDKRASIDVHLFWTFSTSFEMSPIIHDNYPRKVPINSPLTLICSTIVEKGMVMTINWFHPSNQHIADNRVSQKYYTTDLNEHYFEVHQNLTIDKTTIADTGNYTCKVSDLRGKTWRTEISVTILSSPKVNNNLTSSFINFTNDAPLYYYAHPGDVVKLIVLINSNINISFINLFWYKNGRKIANGKNEKLKSLNSFLNGNRAVLKLINFSKNDEGVYTLNGSFFQSSSNISFTVNEIDHLFKPVTLKNFLVFFFIFVSFCFIACMLWFLCIIKVFKKNLNQDSESIKIFQQIASTKYVFWKKNSKSKLYKSCAKEIKFEKILGSGEYGVVWMARIYGLGVKKAWKQVAIKMLKESSTEIQRKILLHEIEFLEKVGQHENVLSLLGVINEKNTLMMIVEYCSKGGLQKYLKENKANFIDQLIQETGKLNKNMLTISSESLTTLKLIEFTRQIASGMKYLESKGIVHRDLAARNIFINEHYVLKIGDFGLAKSSDYIIQSSTPLPYKWMAIESLERGFFTIKSDVWSFGILIWEIFTLGEEPYPNINGFQRLRSFLDLNRLNRPFYCPTFLADLMMKCWEVTPQLRPTFSKIYLDISSNLYLIKYCKSDF